MTHTSTARGEGEHCWNQGSSPGWNSWRVHLRSSGSLATHGPGQGGAKVTGLERWTVTASYTLGFRPQQLNTRLQASSTEGTRRTAPCSTWQHTPWPRPPAASCTQALSRLGQRARRFQMRSVSPGPSCACHSIFMGTGTCCSTVPHQESTNLSPRHASSRCLHLPRPRLSPAPLWLNAHGTVNAAVRLSPREGPDCAASHAQPRTALTAHTYPRPTHARHGLPTRACVAEAALALRQKGRSCRKQVELYKEAAHGMYRSQGVSHTRLPHKMSTRTPLAPCYQPAPTAWAAFTRAAFTPRTRCQHARRWPLCYHPDPTATPGHLQAHISLASLPPHAPASSPPCSAASARSPPLRKACTRLSNRPTASTASHLVPLPQLLLVVRAVVAVVPAPLHEALVARPPRAAHVAPHAAAQVVEVGHQPLVADVVAVACGKERRRDDT